MALVDEPFSAKYLRSKSPPRVFRFQRDEARIRVVTNI